MQESWSYWNPASQSPQRTNFSNFLFRPFSSSNSPLSAPGRFVSLSSLRSFPWRTYHTLLASTRNESLRPSCKRRSFYGTISNPIYGTGEMSPLPTPLGTTISSPCQINTVPLTPMRAPLAAYSIPLSMSVMSSASFLTSPVLNSFLSLSSSL